MLPEMKGRNGKKNASICGAGQGNGGMDPFSGSYTIPHHNPCIPLFDSLLTTR